MDSFWNGLTIQKRESPVKINRIFSVTVPVAFFYDEKIWVRAAGRQLLFFGILPGNVLVAGSVLDSVPPVILYYCFRRYLLKGLVAGFVK